jgi:Spy/CpxP family protein refolding chaperone
MAAERNSFPGPAHVLELDEALALSPEQRTETRALFARMREEAVAAGARLMAAESALDALFASGAVDEPRLRAAVDRLNASRADLQFIHLRTHIAMRALLTPAQVARYDELRGHRAEIPAPAHRH